MALKFAVLGIALVLAWFVLLRPMRGLPRPQAKPRKSPGPAPLVACSRCGVYRPDGDPCDCDP